FHGGVSFTPYANQYKKLLPKKGFRYYEIYNASEGFFAIQDQNNSNELLLMLDYGIFYEFIPMEIYGLSEEKAIPLSEVELNKNYAIIITTNAGLWRYKVGDTVRFTSLSPYRIKITGRTRSHINVFGEELIIENAEQALKKVCKLTKAEIVDYTAAPIFMEGKEKGGHEWLIEFKTPPQDIDYFNELFDNALKALNSDYEAKRYNNITLNKPVIHVARERLFYDWLKQNNKLGGQHKIPRLSNNRDYLEALLNLDHQV
ncbi:MAG: GH3 auxin-responsive promoter family protein, partial [Flavobacteriales bacterium]